MQEYTRIGPCASIRRKQIQHNSPACYEGSSTTQHQPPAASTHHRLSAHPPQPHRLSGPPTPLRPAPPPHHRGEHYAVYLPRSHPCQVPALRARQHTIGVAALTLPPTQPNATSCGREDSEPWPRPHSRRAGRSVRPHDQSAARFCAPCRQCAAPHCERLQLSPASRVPPGRGGGDGGGGERAAARPGGRRAGCGWKCGLGKHCALI
jgi:hypothetical protein